MYTNKYVTSAMSEPSDVGTTGESDEFPVGLGRPKREDDF